MGDLGRETRKGEKKEKEERKGRKEKKGRAGSEGKTDSKIGDGFSEPKKICVVAAWI